MTRTATSPYNVVEHLHTPEEMASYLEVCMEETSDGEAFIAMALGDIARAREHVASGLRSRPAPSKSPTRRSREIAIRFWTRFSRCSACWVSSCVP